MNNNYNGTSLKLFIIAKLKGNYSKGTIMKKGIIYIALVFFISALAASCSSKKACSAYAKEDVKVNQTEVSI